MIPSERKAIAVDPAMWTLEPTFGSAGGPLQHRLTELGLRRSYEVGAGVSSATGAILRDLAARKGGPVPALRTTSACHVVPTPFGAAHVYLDLLRAVSLGLVVADFDLEHPTYLLTAAGRTAHERGEAEQTRLLERVKRAHPIEAPTAPARTVQCRCGRYYLPSAATEWCGVCASYVYRGGRWVPPRAP